MIFDVDVTAMAGVVCSAVFGYAGYVTGVKKCSKDEGTKSGEIQADIGYIKKGVDDIRIDIKTQEKVVNNLAERVTRVEESTKQAHKRLDRVDGAKKEDDN